jgi:hypothetical protein
MRRLEIKKGQRFGRLTVIREIEKKGNRRFKCKCDCGNECTVRLNSLRNGNTTSCNCLQKEVASKIHTKHGLCTYPLYGVWHSMKDRCYNKNLEVYKNYGGRGVTVCDEWRDDPEAFIKWALENGWKPDLELDKDKLVPGNKIYSPSTCCFIPRREQAKYRRNVRTVLDQGELIPFVEFYEKSGSEVPYKRAKDRYYKLSWSLSRSLEI